MSEAFHQHWKLVSFETKGGESNAIARTGCDFLFPHAHLVVDKPVLLHVVAILYELAAHLLDEVVFDDGLRRLRSMACGLHVFDHVELLLEQAQPAVVELFPQLEAHLIMRFVVAY